jgi:hypothetical protein
MMRASENDCESDGEREIVRGAACGKGASDGAPESTSVVDHVQL